MKHLFPFFVLFLSASAVFAAAEYTSVEEVAKDAKLNRDFQIQGEYQSKDCPRIPSLYIIAGGNGTFSAVAFDNAEGWQRKNQREFFAGNLAEDGKLLTIVSKEIERNGRREKSRGDSVSFAVNISDGKLVMQDKENSEKNATFEKIVRKSPTLSQKAPEGAVVLFDDGKASDLWEHAVVNEQAKTLWSEAWTKPFEKRPYTLHIEFMTSYMPEARGQGRSNSGVYIDERYECQILDSFGLDGKNNECGGFYQQAEPLVNMCYPPLTWQTYDIDFVPAKFDAEGKKTANAKLTVKHNGVVIHDNFEPKHETPGRKKESPEARGIYLQGHGNKAQYKNIWLKYQ
jgi:hypothetical protein